MSPKRGREEKSPAESSGPAGFDAFFGNARIVSALRGMLSSGRVPHALLFTGPRGIGKYTLARMFAQAANCERLKDDFCGECDPCRRIGLLADPRPLMEQGLAERGESADAATVERIPLILQTHPDVWVFVPDPIRLKSPVVRPVLHVGQLRAIQRAAYFRPTARRRVFILDGADTMRRDYSNIFLKVLEEPPESATLILLAPNPFALLPTIRSRCIQFGFASLEAEQVDHVLREHTELGAAERKLAAELTEGSPGVAMELDLGAAEELRLGVLAILENAAGSGSFGELFGRTAQLAKQREIPFERVLDVFYSLLSDLLKLVWVPSERTLRNPTLRKQLEALSRKVDPSWVAMAIGGLDRLYGRLRRNVNRQLGLDAVATSLAGRAAGSGQPSR
ncbi:MAG: ATP-binding protein [Candidatus Acidiferrales bacterium]